MTIDVNIERYNRAKSIREELRVMRDKRDGYYKKYSKASSRLHYTTMVISSMAVMQTTAGIATSATVVGIPVGIVVTSLGATMGLVATVLTPISKRCLRKKVKHAKKLAILSAGLSSLDEKISSVLDDNSIDESEFNSVVEEYKLILTRLKSVDSKEDLTA